jgi:hypothetical protein
MSFKFSIYNILLHVAHTHGKLEVKVYFQLGLSILVLWYCLSQTGLGLLWIFGGYSG